MTRTPYENAVSDLLQRVAEHARAHPGVAPDPVLGDDRRRPRRSATVSVFAALLVVVALAGASQLVGDDRRGVISANQPAGLEGTTDRLAGSGLAARSNAASVWTGKELLVWGGLTLDGSGTQWLADGAALDPAANRWRRLPPAPIGPRHSPAAVWTGTEMVVSGGSGPEGVVADGAAFNPETNRWRTIASQPSGGTTRPAAVWTGKELFIVTSLNGLSASAYDPKADRWRRLADPPGAPVMPYPQVVWTGSQAVLVLWPAGQGGTGIGSSSSPAAPTTRPVDPVTTSTPPPPLGPPPPLLEVRSPSPVLRPNSQMFVAAYSPGSDQWSRLPAVALTDGGLPRLVWTGREVLALQVRAPGAAFDVGRQAWRPLAPIPAGIVTDADPVWTGRMALLWSGGGRGLAYDLDADTWRTFDAGGLRERTGAVVAWTDGVLVGWGGFNNHDDGSGRLEGDGIRYRPPLN